MLPPFKGEHFGLDDSTCIIEHGRICELATMLKVKCLSFTPTPQNQRHFFLSFFIPYNQQEENGQRAT